MKYKKKFIKNKKGESNVGPDFTYSSSVKIGF